MTLLVALVVGVLFGSGSYLLLKADLLRVVAGLVLISNAAILALLGAGVTRGQAPILPLSKGVEASDPLVQALALTALVIGFATTALLLVLVYRVHGSLETVDLDELSQIEARREEELEAAERPSEEVSA
ncbi:MAG: sodium:proton antiporter [Actinomycetota bacterium]|nr:sodium:proton antiporter [Actinomycetota bacterium]